MAQADKTAVAQLQQNVITANAMQTFVYPGMLRITKKEAPKIKIRPEIFRLHQQYPSQPLTNSFQSLPAKQNYLPGSRQAAEQVCTDSSFIKLLGITNAAVYINDVTQTADGGVLIPCYIDDTTYTGPSAGTYGLLIKADADGSIDWIRQFECGQSSGCFYTWMIRAFELSNNDIICYGAMQINSNTNTFKTIVCRFSSTGNLIWKNVIHSTIGIFNSPSGTFSFFVEGVADGLNGDVILAGTSNSNLSSGKIETVVRLNSSGQLVWDANFGNHGADGSYRFGAEGVNVFVQNGEIILAGLSHGTNNPITPAAINFLKLDYSNGNLINKRFFLPDYTDINEEFQKTFTFWYNNFIRLQNGHYLFSGKLFSDFMNVTPIKEHFGVVEFDANFNLVNAYTIRSGLTTNYYNNFLHFDQSGKAVLTLLEYLGSYEANVFFAAYENGQFLKQRKVYYPSTGMPGNNGFIFSPDNGYAYIQTHFATQPVAKSHIEFRKMHNSDTASVCFGKDSLLLSFGALNIIEDPNYFYLDPNEPNKMLSSNEAISITDTITHNAINGCEQKNFCDTVKIHGPSNICGAINPVTYTSFKNTECGGIVQWNMPSNAIDSFKVVNDTTVQVWYKNINWQGYIYASLPAGACNAPASDSLQINLIASPTPVNLGPDLELCNQNTLQLHAGNFYNTYLWQDASTDSLLTVTQPGLYWVEVTDACNNRYRDSITISPLIIQVDIGPDRIKCNNDTIQLQASAGFINYQWSENYYISSLTTAQTVVNPPMDTAYYLRAEKFPGCYAYDTVRITVNNSPPVNLGPDTRFCTGDSIVLNAGNGFSQYQWSTGANSPALVVHNSGTYSLAATAANGCISRDTITIGPLHALPVINLGADAPLCSGSTRTLNAGNGYTVYVWNTGSTAPFITANTTGMYFVQVTDANGCKGTDTVRVTQLLPLPAGFLPGDTAICSYGTITLQPLSTYNQYNWSTGSIQPTITIAQPGTYWLQVRDNNNCAGTDTIIVDTKECSKGLFVPSGFTPNNDGKNDVLKPFLFGNVLSYRFVIYNRWGHPVFQSVTVGEGWNGMVKGVPTDGNVFVWQCTYQLQGEAVQNAKGTVTLIR